MPKRGDGALVTNDAVDGVHSNFCINSKHPHIASSFMFHFLVISNVRGEVALRGPVFVNCRCVARILFKSSATGRSSHQNGDHDHVYPEGEKDAHERVQANIGRVGLCLDTRQGQYVEPDEDW